MSLVIFQRRKLKMKVHCPNHQDENPSAHVYDNGTFCFVCHKMVETGDVKSIPLKKKVVAENITGRIAEIRNLDTKRWRGLDFHADNFGCYILYPSGDYYKYRLFSPSQSGSKYLGPVGHSQPLFFFKEEGNKEKLLIIEGEINAMTVLEYNNYSVLSPGSAGNFLSKIDEIISIAIEYGKIVVWADKDPPGIKAIMELTSQLKIKGKKVEYIMEDMDANEMLLNGKGISSLINETFERLS